MRATLIISSDTSTPLADVLTPPCVLCGERGIVEGVSQEAALRWEAGALIQDAFPHLSPETREQMISGTHPACWAALFSPSEEDAE